MGYDIHTSLHRKEKQQYTTNKQIPKTLKLLSVNITQGFTEIDKYAYMCSGKPPWCFKKADRKKITKQEETISFSNHADTNVFTPDRMASFYTSHELTQNLTALYKMF